jgi:hypothetical protein
MLRHPDILIDRERSAAGDHVDGRASLIGFGESHVYCLTEGINRLVGPQAYGKRPAGLGLDLNRSALGGVQETSKLRGETGDS